jgi:hypothetical protein
MLEIVWDTTTFNNKADWPEDGLQPFYLSTGDRTGYGQHGMSSAPGGRMGIASTNSWEGDYVFGWKGDSLQRAMDGGCTGASCRDLKVITNEEAIKCKVPERVKEKWEGCKYPTVNSPETAS